MNRLKLIGFILMAPWLISLIVWCVMVIIAELKASSIKDIMAIFVGILAIIGLICELIAF